MYNIKSTKVIEVIFFIKWKYLGPETIMNHFGVLSSGCSVNYSKNNGSQMSFPPSVCVISIYLWADDCYV